MSYNKVTLVTIILYTYKLKISKGKLLKLC